MKSTKPLCVSCGILTFGKYPVCLHLKKGKQLDLSGLLAKYGGVYICEGYMCRACCTQLLSLSKKADKFRERCQASIHKLQLEPCTGKQIQCSAYQRPIPLQKPSPHFGKVKTNSSNLNALGIFSMLMSKKDHN